MGVSVGSSIYNAPSIYESGAGGGGGGNIGTLQPILTVTAQNGVDFQNECFVINQGVFRTSEISKQNSIIEIEIIFSLKNINEFNSIMSPIVHWGNIDIHIEYYGTQLWLGVPNSSADGWQNWNNGQNYFDLSGIGKTIQSNTFYKLNVKMDSANKTIDVKLDNILIISGSFSQAPNLSNSRYNLFANFDDSINYRSSGYIKYNNLKIYTDGTRVI